MVRITRASKGNGGKYYRALGTSSYHFRLRRIGNTTTVDMSANYTSLPSGLRNNALSTPIMLVNVHS